MQEEVLLLLLKMEDPYWSAWQQRKRKFEATMADHISLHLHCLHQNQLLAAIQGDSNIDHRLLPREEKTEYDHERALYCINSDYLNEIPRFKGKEFQTMFRISRTRFERLWNDIGRLQDPFFTRGTDGTGALGASLEAKLLLPLKCMAYGVPPHTFRDYFQMSATLAKTCCKKFYKVVVKLYQFEYLRMPTSEDLNNITKLHKEVHGVDGMFGSLDCMHTWWKNCPVAWKGSYKGKEKRSSIVLEAACDHHLWLWHAAYGYAGTLNDLNILNLSPLMDRMLDGTFQTLEKDSVPFTVDEEEFQQLFLLVDGIYPNWSRFVKGVLQPLGRDQRKFTKWQESARKDIERAFGVLQCVWQCVSRPIYLMKLEQIKDMITAAIILHNIGVADRVMDGDVYARYNPACNLDEDQTAPENQSIPADINEKRKRKRKKTDSLIHYCGDRDVYKVVTGPSRWSDPTNIDAVQRWEDLQNVQEYERLRNALIKLKSNN